MKNLIHLIRCDLSGMFTKNIVDDVIERIERIIERYEKVEKMEH